MMQVKLTETETKPDSYEKYEYSFGPEYKYQHLTVTKIAGKWELYLVMKDNEHFVRHESNLDDIRAELKDNYDLGFELPFE